MALALIIRCTPKSAAFQSSGLQLLLKNVPTMTSVSNFTSVSNGKVQPWTLTTTGKRSPVTILCSREMSGDHSKLWPIEKAVSVLLLGLLPATVLTPNIILDNLAAVATVIHFHWGLEACAVDYIRPIIFGNAIPKLALGLLYLISATTLGGLIYYNVNDIGIGKTIRQFWAIKK